MSKTFKGIKTNRTPQINEAYAKFCTGQYTQAELAREYKFTQACMRKYLSYKLLESGVRS